MAAHSNAETLGLCEQVLPWMDLLQNYSVKRALVASSTSTQTRIPGVVVELSLREDKLSPRNDVQQTELVRALELMDLLQLMVVVSPGDFVELIERRVQHNLSRCEGRYFLNYVRDGVPVALQFNFYFRGFDTGVLESWLAAPFFGRLRHRLPTSRPYRGIRRALVRKVVDHRRFETNPVRVFLCVNSWEVQKINEADTVEFFDGLAKFSSKLHSIDASQAPPQWRLNLCPVPVVFSLIELDVIRMCITPKGLHAAKAFMAAGIPVNVRELNLDATMIQCPKDDLAAFVSTMSAGSTACTIKTETWPDAQEVYSVDQRGKDRRETIRSITNAICSEAAIHSVDIGGLAMINFSVLNRLEIFGHALVSLLARSPPLPVLHTGVNVVLSQADVDAFRASAEKWRTVHPNGKLQVKRLIIESNEESPGVLQQYVSLFDDAEEVIISRTMIEARLLPSIVQTFIHQFSSLRKLHLGSVVIQSMDLFDPLVRDPIAVTKPLLESLVLADIELLDQPSMARFIKQLGTPGHPLAKSLREFRVVFDQFWFVQGRFGLDGECVAELTKVLSTNRVLENVSVALEPPARDGASAAMAEQVKQLWANDGRLIPRHRSELRSSFYRRQKTAFLSIIRGGLPGIQTSRQLLDAAIVNLIFGFSAPHSYRRVQVLTGNH